MMALLELYFQNSPWSVASEYRKHVDRTVFSLLITHQEPCGSCIVLPLRDGSPGTERHRVACWSDVVLRAWHNFWRNRIAHDNCSQAARAPINQEIGLCPLESLKQMSEERMDNRAWNGQNQKLAGPDMHKFCLVCSIWFFQMHILKKFHRADHRQGILWVRGDGEGSRIPQCESNLGIPTTRSSGLAACK